MPMGDQSARTWGVLGTLVRTIRNIEALFQPNDMEGVFEPMFQVLECISGWVDGHFPSVRKPCRLLSTKEEPLFDHRRAQSGWSWRQSGVSLFPAFAPDPASYRKHGLEPPKETPRDPQKEKQLQGLVNNAA